MTTLGLTPASKPVRSRQLLWLENNFTSSYLPDLASYDFHLFGPLKEGLQGQYFSSDEEIKTAVGKWLKMQPVELYNEGICALVKKVGKGSSERRRLH